MSKKIKIEFQKGTPNFLTKLKQQHGYHQNTIDDKLQVAGVAIDESEYDLQNAQIVTDNKTDLQVTKDDIANLIIKNPESRSPDQSSNMDMKEFKPKFIKPTDKKEKNKIIIENNVKKNKQTNCAYKLSSQTVEEFQQRTQHNKEKILHEKTKKVFKSNKHLLSFDD